MHERQTRRLMFVVVTIDSGGADRVIMALFKSSRARTRVSLLRCTGAEFRPPTGKAAESPQPVVLSA